MNPMTPGPAAPQSPIPPPPQPAARPWYRMKRVWAGGVVALLVIAGAAGGGSKKDAALTVQKGAEATTQPTAAPTTVTTSAPATTAPKPTTTTTVKVTTTTTEAVSSCEAVKEAFLTGTQPEINAALTRLIADKTEDGTAREYADYYMHRDAPPAFGSKDLRSMDMTLIRSACS